MITIPEYHFSGDYYYIWTKSKQPLEILSLEHWYGLVTTAEVIAVCELEISSRVTVNNLLVYHFVLPYGLLQFMMSASDCFTHSFYEVRW